MTPRALGQDGRRGYREDRLPLPPIPKCGPTGQLGPEVLVARVKVRMGGAKLGAPVDDFTSPRTSPLSGRLRQAPEFLPRLPLPTVDATPRSRPGKGQVAQSARARLETDKFTVPRKRQGIDRAGGSATPGLTAFLYKGDHTLRFAGIDSNEDDSRYQDRPDTAIRKMLLVPPPIAVKLGRRDSSSSSAQASSVSDRGSFNLKRHQRLRDCFRRDPAEIDRVMASLDAFRTNTVLESDPLDWQPEVKKLADLFEKTGLVSAPARVPEPIIAVGVGMPPSEAEAPGPESRQEADPTIDAGNAEVTLAVSLLNFVRWLCGLPLVEIDPACQRICDMISHVLLPRGEGKKAGANVAGSTQTTRAALAEFADAMTRYLEANRDHVSIMHGEGSLAAAVEEGLMATHMVSAPPALIQERPRHERAAAVAARVQADAASAKEVRPSRANPRLQPPEPENESLRPDTLPEALSRLKVFWELSGKRHAGTAGKEAAQDVEGSSGHYGLSAIWGDKHGALAFRRTLLHPAFQRFGAVRRQDTCVLWTPLAAGTDTPLQQVQSVVHRTPSKFVGVAVDAVCFPPPGYVPVWLLGSGHVPWTIMPDSARFQPTANTSITVWRVKIERNAGREWTAERLEEVSVQGFAVDCSQKGEPFCVIFWPDLRADQQGDQLEVALRGLRGDKTELTFFYQFQRSRRMDSERQLCAEAAKLRGFFGAAELWGSPPMPLPVEESDGGGSPRNALGAMYPGLPRRRASTLALLDVGDAPQLLSTSHSDRCITAKGADVRISLYSPDDIAIIMSRLFKIRSGGEEKEEIPRASQVFKLDSKNYVVRVKLPFARSKYELRFFVASRKQAARLASGTGSDLRLRHHPLTFSITSSDKALLKSFDDPNCSKFGYCKLSPLLQHYGILVLAPLMHRIETGTCYFLVAVDAARAIAAAQAEAGKASPADDPQELREKAQQRAQPYDEKLRRAPGKRTRRQAPCKEQQQYGTKLFSARLLRDSADQAAEGGGVSVGISPMYSIVNKVRPVLEQGTQDSGGEVHLDIALHNGEVVRRLRERRDFPGLYEGLATIGDVDVHKGVQLILRLPRVHAAEYSPRVLARWQVYRHEHVPLDF
eukprot:TRINITY_DN19274_c0_g1_i1.p1 TRINITY_DN19274_c0_g1~~TRINITY_DN19274_c0_g1_i1.p1  ORF type:complete len:1108 (+),score=216.53 TRINITY_DN19274_c0_g1_i1:116-3439(+)